MEAKSMRIEEEGAMFLQQFPSTPTGSLAGDFQVSPPPEVYAVRVDRVGAKYQASFVKVEPQLPPRPVKHKKTTLSTRTQEPMMNHTGDTVQAPRGVKKFVIFAACVVRSFYIVRFQANDNPDDPIGLEPGFGPIRHCPQPPQYYLDRAFEFSERFFQEDFSDFRGR